MYVPLLLLQIFLNVVDGCPTVCVCEYGIVNCVNQFLVETPQAIPANTRILNLSNNQIVRLTESSLAGLYNLEELHIQNNLLSSIHENTFRSNTKLKLLNLMSNNLHALPDSLLNTNNELVQIDIRNNIQLSYVPYSLIQNTYTLKSLIANNVECGCDMTAWFEKMQYFDHNDITIDITCYNPSVLRGYKLRNVPDTTFEGCYSAFSDCNTGEVGCTDGGMCIPEQQWCDGNYDCFDLSDETSCSTDNYSDGCDTATKYECDNGKCIPRSWLCDEVNDCQDMSDEMNCTNELPSCAKEYFECSNRRCINQSGICDETNDCGDWSDESKLLCGDEDTRNICPAGWLVCQSGEGCIEHNQVCDGIQDCTDDSDEINCGNCTVECESDRRCIKESWLCDMKPDCTDSSDEVNCDYICGVDEIKCANGGCISCSFVCDGYNDCLDGSDEISCAICNGSICLESVQTESSMLTIIIVATAASASISIACVILFVVVYRKRKKYVSRIPQQPPLYTEIEFSSPGLSQSYRSNSPGGVPHSPPPRYKSEPDIVARLTSNQSVEHRDIGLNMEDSGGSSESDDGI